MAMRFVLMEGFSLFFFFFFSLWACSLAQPELVPPPILHPQLFTFHIFVFVAVPVYSSVGSVAREGEEGDIGVY